MNVRRAILRSLTIARTRSQRLCKTAFTQVFLRPPVMQGMLSPFLYHKTIRFISSDRPPPQTADYLESAIRQALKQPVEELKQELRQEIRAEIQTLGQFVKQPDASRSNCRLDRDEDRYELLHVFLLAFLGGAIIASCFAWGRYRMVMRILDDMIAEMTTGNPRDVDWNRTSREKERKRWYEMDDRKVKDYMMCA